MTNDTIQREAELQIILCDPRDGYTVSRIVDEITEAVGKAKQNGPHGLRVQDLPSHVARGLQRLGLDCECGVFYAR